MDLIRFTFRTAPSAFVLSVVCSAIGGLATTALLVIINGALTHAAPNSYSILSFCGLVLIALAFRAAAALQLAKLGQSSLFNLRRDLSRQILATPFRTLEILGPARVLAVLTDDIPAITNFVANAPMLCTNAAILLACLGYMALLSWPLLVVVLAFLVAGLASYEYLMSIANRHIEDAREQGAKLIQHFRSLLSGMKELKLHKGRSQAFMTSCLDSTANQYQSHMVDGLKIYAGATVWGELLMFVAIGVVVFMSLGGHRTSPANLAAFVLVLLYLVGPLESVINLSPQAGRATAALKNVNDLGLTLSSRDSLQVPGTRVSLFAQPEEIRLHRVRFDYVAEDRSDTFSIGPLSLTFPAGQIVFVVGGNGSGKSTFAKLLTGLYTPVSGTVTVGGRLVDDETRDDYRQRFATVFADFHLFESLLGIDCPNLDRVAAAYLERLHLSGKVTITDGRLSTLDLSQGQRKRLALMVAYLEDRPFYLFDEWAADQDPIFKEIFYYEILPDLKDKGKTVFVITHDDRYFHVADRIVKLDNGNVLSDRLQQAAVLQEGGLI